MIRSFTKAYIRHYSDTDHTMAYVEWVDSRGRNARTEGKPDGIHMRALMTNASRHGVTVTRENW